MKRILLYLLMAISMAAIAQQQAGDGAGNSHAAQAQSEQRSDTAQGSEDETLDTSTSNEDGDDAETQAEQAPDTGQHSEDEHSELLQQTDPDDSDFEPGEEISEDYPVPLPSDI